MVALCCLKNQELHILNMSLNMGLNVGLKNMTILTLEGARVAEWGWACDS